MVAARRDSGEGCESCGDIALAVVVGPPACDRGVALERDGVEPASRDCDGGCESCGDIALAAVVVGTSFAAAALVSRFGTPTPLGTDFGSEFSFGIVPLVTRERVREGLLNVHLKTSGISLIAKKRLP